MIEVAPLLGGEAAKDELGCVVHHGGAGQVFKEVDRGTLVEVLDGMLLDTEYDGLGAGEQDCEQPGQHHHQPGPGPLPHLVQGVQGAADADVPEEE